MSIIVETPFQNFTGLDGKPLTNGKVYIGQVGTDPTVFANQIPVFWDETMTIPASQPLTTNAGYIVRLGTPARVWVSTDYSMSVKNSSNVLVYYYPQFGVKNYPSSDDLLSSNGSSLIGWIRNAIGAVYRSVKDKLYDDVTTFDFMTSAQKEDVAEYGYNLDISPAVQAALNHCTLTGKRLRVIAGGYRLNSQIYKSESFKCPVIVGDGAGTTIFKGFGIAVDTALLKIKGGSGQFTDSTISGINFTGGAGMIGVEVADQCGLTFSTCKFDTLKLGLLLHNEHGFTEYVTAYDCDFTSNCQKALEYKRTGGTESFHGSGLSGQCTINEPPAATESSIEIGIDCLVYNAPLSFQVWKRTTLPVIAHNGSPKSNVYGVITAELFFDNSLSAELVAGNDLFILGCDPACLSRSLGTISARFVSRFNVNPDGTVNFSELHRVMPPIGMIPGVITLFGTPNQQTLLVDILFAAANYEYAYTLIFYVNPTDGGGAATVLSNNRSFNAAGYGPVSFSVSAGTLIATNANFPATGVVALISYTQIGDRYQSRLQ